MFSLTLQYKKVFQKRKKLDKLALLKIKCTTNSLMTRDSLHVKLKNPKKLHQTRKEKFKVLRQISVSKGLGLIVNKNALD